MSANNVCGDQSTSTALQSLPVAHLLSHGTSYRTPSLSSVGCWGSSSAAVQQQFSSGAAGANPPQCMDW